MSYRALALAPLLFALACGGAAPSPSPKDATTPPPGDGTRGAHMDAGDGSGDKPKTDGAAPPATGGGLGSHKGAEPAPPPGGPETAIVDTKEPLGGGTLSQEDIRKLLEKNQEVFGECYTLGAGGSKTKEFLGTIKVKATLGPNGSVNDVKVLSSTMKNPKVDACVSNAFKKIKFPAPKNAGTSVITFPINFGAVEEVKH